MLELRIFIAVVAVCLTAVGLYFTWHRRHKEELRREEVLEWTLDAVGALQGLFMLSVLEDGEISDDERRKRVLDAVFLTSILIEHGRLFFKNEPSEHWGLEKPSAYQGFRPKILDYLVIAHQVARAWPDENNEQRMRRSMILDDCAKNFLSLAQQEVGRSRAASVDAKKGGDGIHLQDIFSTIVEPHQYRRPSA